MLSDQIEGLLGSYGSTQTLGRNLIGLSGFLADPPPPENVAAQLERLSRLLLLQEMFDKLIQALNHATRSTGGPSPEGEKRERAAGSVEISRILDQIEAVRGEISALDPVNYAVLIAWLVARARERKILKGGHDRR
jgi:hypothetical protein